MKNEKTKTREQIAKIQAKAVRFLRDVAGDSAKADEIAGLSVAEYAERKHITIENPGKTERQIRTLRHRKPRRNPDETAAAEDLFEDFHGKAPTKILEVQTDEIGRDTYSALGELYDLRLNSSGERYTLTFEKCHVKLCSSADGSQLYLIGGDQDCSQALPSDAPNKDFVSLGTIERISYVTRKGFDKFKETTYEHKFGEEGGEKPWALFVRPQKRIFIVDGDYRVESPGIMD